MEKSRDSARSSPKKATTARKSTRRPARGEVDPAEQLRETLNSVAPGERTTVTAEERLQMIAETAYYRAEKRGFVEDDAQREEDWLEAEKEVDEILEQAGVGRS